MIVLAKIAIAVFLLSAVLLAETSSVGCFGGDFTVIFQSDHILMVVRDDFQELNHMKGAPYY